MKKKTAPKASQQAISIVPTNTDRPNTETVGYWLDKARLGLEQDDLESAIDAYQNATRIDPDCEFWVEMGERCLNENKLAQAFIAFEQANKLDPSNAFRASYWEWLGRTYEAGGDYNAALEAYSKWASAAPDSIEPVDLAGALLVTQELWTDLPVLRNLYVERSKANGSEYNPDVLESMALYAYFLERKLGSKEDPSAQELAYATLRDKYDSISMRYLLGCIYFDLERYDSADNEFVRALKLINKNPDWHEFRFNLDWTANTAIFMRGRIAQRLHRYDEALEFFNACLSEEHNKGRMPENLQAIYARLRLQLDTGALEDAKAIINDLCFSIKANLIQQHNKLATTIDFTDLPDGLNINDYPEYIQAIVLDKATSWRHQVNLECALRLGDLFNAEQTLHSIIENAHDDCDYESEGQEEIALIPSKSRTLDAVQKALQDGNASKAIAALRRHCENYPHDHERVTMLAKLLVENHSGKRLGEEIDYLLEKYHDCLGLWEIAHDYYQASGQKSRARLAYVNMNCLRAASYHPPISEWFCPASNTSSAQLIAVSARAFAGSGQIIITGGDMTVGGIAQIAQSYMRAEAEQLHLQNIESFDIHLNLRTLGHREVSLSEFTQSQQNKDDSNIDKQDLEPEICNENIGLAIFLAMYHALRGERPQQLTLVGGTIDLYGNVGSSPSLGSGLDALANYEGECWERLIVPQQLAPELLQSCIPMWGTVENIIIGTTIAQIVTALRETH